VSRAAAPAGAIAAMTTTELRLTARRGENLLATIVIPAIVLILFSSVSILPTSTARPVDFLLPGSIALGIIATSLVSLGITTAYDRTYGVLKRLGGAPLTRAQLVIARVLAVLAVEGIQVVLLVAVAVLLLGWRPGAGASPILALLAVLLGTAAFAGLGLLLAGTLRGETVLALANVLFLGFLVAGGVIVPLDRLPAPVAAVAGALPAAPLSAVLRIALGASTGDVATPLVLLAAWTAVTFVLTTRTFRWE
jgi:ABC-2 type transport system permease protein